MKATYIELYDLLMRLPTEEKVVVAVPDKQSAENLRVSLVRRHAEFVAVEISSDSLCSDYDKEAGTLSVWIGAPRRRQPVVFEILSTHGQQIHNPVERDPQERSAGNSSLPQEGTGTADQSDPTAEEQDQRESQGDESALLRPAGSCS